MKIFRRRFLIYLTATAVFTTAATRSQGIPGEGNENIIYLKENWSIQSAAQAKSKGKEISSTSFNASGWYPTAVPTTVLSALVQDGVYKDIYFGTNLDAIPPAQFTNGTWWYRREIDVSPEQANECADLIFEGINYHANVWLNGVSVASADETYGAFRMFRFDVTGRLKPGKNVVAVEVVPPKAGDFTIGFVDWNPKPPDRNMGLFRPVILHLYKTVGVENVFVESKIDHETWQKADLTACADLVNHSENPVETTLKGKIDGVTFSEEVTLQAGEKRAIEFTPENFPQLKLDRAKLWWPWELGEPYLYTFKLTSQVGGTITDQTETRFGVREVADYINPQGYRGYMVNGKKILIRGGGWADELLLHEDENNLKSQVHYTKAMNLNTIRLEGFWGGSQTLYDLADENGMLIMVGWSCQWEWPEYLGKKCDEKYGGFITEAEMSLATNYLHDQVLWLRNHPSIFVWVLGSDMLPKPELEKKYDTLLAVIDPTRPTLKSCGSVTSTVSGPSAVKMNGPYDYVTPDYWYLDRVNGGAFGFNTETGPGPQPPPLETLQRMFPVDSLWPTNVFWNFHSGRNEFHNIDRYMNAFNHRYGGAKSAGEFAFKSQAANYEAIRAMYEAFAVNLPQTTGIIQWMLNASWPKLYWQLYDYYLIPGGSFFGAKKGAAVMSVIYDYGDRGVYLANLSDHSRGKFRTTIAVYDLNSRKILEQAVTNAGPVFGSTKIFDLSKLASKTPVFFLDLATQNAAGKTVANNFYWLSTKPDVLDEDKTEWFVTPNKSFADLTALNQLPATTVSTQVSFTPLAGGTDAEVTLNNPSDHLAFFIEMRVVGAQSQQTLLPVFWDDNYVSIPPHTRKTFHAYIPVVPDGEKPELRLQGWNVKFETAG
jgi:exo-1,4-beta-D-glucosaminidase